MTALPNRYTPISKIVAYAPKYFFDWGKLRPRFYNANLAIILQFSKFYA